MDYYIAEGTKDAEEGGEDPEQITEAVEPRG
jgi:hypothetical protein